MTESCDSLRVGCRDLAGYRAAAAADAERDDDARNAYAGCISNLDRRWNENRIECGNVLSLTYWKLMAYPRRLPIWKTVMFFAVTTDLFYAHWGPY